VLGHSARNGDRFIRCTLTQKLIDHCEDLEYALWVSLSEKGFNDYFENFNNENHEAKYFGWLCNHLPDYEFPESFPATGCRFLNAQAMM
jgi:hypothetical protein